MRDMKAVCAVFKVVRHRKVRCARLFIPALELRQIAASRVGERGQPILDRGGLAVVAVEIQIQRGALAVVANQAFQHAHEFGTIVIYVLGVEV